MWAEPTKAVRAAFVPECLIKGVANESTGNQRRKLFP